MLRESMNAGGKTGGAKCVETKGVTGQNKHKNT